MFERAHIHTLNRRQDSEVPDGTLRSPGSRPAVPATAAVGFGGAVDKKDSR